MGLNLNGEPRPMRSGWIMKSGDCGFLGLNLTFQVFQHLLEGNVLLPVVRSAGVCLLFIAGTQLTFIYHSSPSRCFQT